MIFINFKSYLSGLGEKGLSVSRECQKLSASANVQLIPVVQTVDLYMISGQINFPLWAQSADAKKPFKNCGYITPQALKEAGAAGFFVNHSDCPKSFDDIRDLVGMAKELDLKTLVFAKNNTEIAKFDSLQADFVSLEDPNLIASDVAMVDKYEGMLTNLIKETKTPLVIGAGIRTKDHYQKSLQLGAAGVVLSSQIMEAVDPIKAVQELVK